MRVLAFFIVLVPLLGQEPFEPDVPRTWDSTALEEWATPLAGLNKRPGHFSEQEYYAAPVTNLRTYPVYYPGREPDGYWKMLNSVGPKPLIEPEKLRTRQDWIRAGKRVFEEYDFPSFRTWDPKIIAAARSVATFERVNYVPRPDGTVHSARWIPSKDGVALGVANCSNCHQRRMPDGTILDGAPTNEGRNPVNALAARWPPSVLPLPGEPLPMTMHRC